MTYLSDIDWKYAQSGWESVMKNQYCNGASSGAISLSVDGEQTYFSKGLGANADATVEYDVSSYKAQLEENENFISRHMSALTISRQQRNRTVMVFIS